MNALEQELVKFCACKPRLCTFPCHVCSVKAKAVLRHKAEREALTPSQPKKER